MATNRTTIAPTPTNLGLHRHKAGRRHHRHHHKVGQVEEGGGGGGATAVVMDLPHTVGITTGPHQGGLHCPQSHQAAHHHMVIRRRLAPAPLTPGPLTTGRTTSGSGPGYLPRRRTRFIFSPSLTVAIGALGGPTQSSQSSRPQVARMISLKIG